MRTRAFWLDVLDRAARTAAQTGVALLSLDGANVLTLDWPATLSAAGTAAVLSVLTSIATSGIGERGTPALVSTGRHARPD